MGENAEMVFTSYFGNAKKLTAADVVMVSVARFQPRFIKAELVKKYLGLMPTKEMLAGRKADTMTAEEFKKEYDDILSHLKPEQVYVDLVALGEGKPVALMCYEGPGQTCHRHYITEWFKKAGIEITEWQDPAQAALKLDDNISDD